MPERAPSPGERARCGRPRKIPVFAPGAGVVLAALLAVFLAGAGLASGLGASLSASLSGIVAGAALVWAAVLARQKRWLCLLDALGRLPNPRFGPDYLIGAALVRLREFHAAEACLAVMAHEDGTRVYCARAGDALARQAACPRLGAALLALPERAAVRAHPAGGGWRDSRLAVWLPGAPRAQALPAMQAAGVLRRLGRRAWASVPLLAGGRVHGRLYVLGGRRYFPWPLLRRLDEAAGRLMPLVDAVTLLDTLASAAAERAQRKISLDLHDSAIQPYLGLRLGLEALRRKLDADSPLAGELDELQQVTEDCIDELRGYVRGLRGQPERRSTALRDGLLRQAARFERLYGMTVGIELAPGLRVNDRLAAEVVRMVGEGLSNIGRHTASRRVGIRLSGGDGLLLARIGDDGGGCGEWSGKGSGKGSDSWRDFIPRSLAARAEQLGGAVRVDPRGDGGSDVLISIPL